MMVNSGPITVMVDTSVVKPFVKTCSTPAKVKLPGSIVASMRAVYGARAMSSAKRNMGLA
jgi:hypothetical protein